MSLETILKKITDDAHNEANRIVQDSRQQAERIKDSARKEAAVSSEAILEENERQARLEASRIVTQARLEKKIEILSCKKELIDEVLNKAFRKVGHEWAGLKREVIDKQGRSEEVLDEKNLLDQLRPKLEKFIADVLNI